MRYISHRGNLTGPSPSEENSLEYILEALQKDFDVEVDLWRVKNRWYFGHDEPQYQVSNEFLLANRDFLWLHCKHREALSAIKHLSVLEGMYHYFWHEEDEYTITSMGWTISYPGIPACNPFALCMMPERHRNLESIHGYLQDEGFQAVCSDYIENLLNLNT